MAHLLLFAGVVLPLGVDTLLLGAALGVVGLPRRDRLRTSLVLAGFEAGMPVVGFLVGAAAARLIGQWAGYGAAGLLLLAGVMLLRPGDEDAETNRLRLLAKAKGFAIVDLGLAISVDELAAGLGLGLLGIPVAVAVLWFAVQGFVAAQLGLRVGAGLGERLRERGEAMAGLTLIGMAVLLLFLKLTSKL